MSRNVGKIEVLHRPATSVDAPDSNYGGLHPSTTVLPKAHKRREEYRGFQAETIFDRDIEILLRDGVRLRADVFRPANESRKVPALLAWSPYGKSGTGFFSLDIIPGRVGVPKSMLSGYEKFEAPDPAEWTARGYAIVNIDARGTFDSEGDIRSSGSGEGQDGYDVIEEIAKLPWCNGKVALVGNSWLAIAQWFIAAEQPPHLACICPFEGASDRYRESVCRGGIPNLGFISFLQSKLYGRNQQEDVAAMVMKYPFWNEYWEDKRAKMDLIKVPTYVVASFSTALHTEGSFRGFEEIPHQKKWLRVHGTMEWHDLYQTRTNDDLQKFLDRYTKDIDNGWEETPQVRISLLNFNADPEIDRIFSAWPVPEAQNTTFYLHQNGTISPTQSPTTADPATLSYQSDAPCMQIDADEGELRFSYTFDRRTTLIGHSKAVLHLSCTDHDDMDIHVQLRKADRAGKLLQNINIPLADLPMATADEVPRLNSLVYLGPTGVHRASRREMDPSLSKPNRPWYTHTRAEKLAPGEIVRVEIGLWPGGMNFEAGESLVLKVAGHPMTLAEFVPLRGAHRGENVGKHVLHLGGEKYDSHIVVPLLS